MHPPLPFTSSIKKKEQNSPSSMNLRKSIQHFPEVAQTHKIQKLFLESQVLPASSPSLIYLYFTFLHFTSSPTPFQHHGSSSVLLLRILFILHPPLHLHPQHHHPLRHLLTRPRQNHPNQQTMPAMRPAPAPHPRDLRPSALGRHASPQGTQSTSRLGRHPAQPGRGSALASI